MHLRAKAMAQARAQTQASDQRALVKYLVGSGLGSRRHCAALVLSGFVTVNGRVAESLTQQVTHRALQAVDTLARGHGIGPHRLDQLDGEGFEIAGVFVEQLAPRTGVEARFDLTHFD